MYLTSYKHFQRQVLISTVATVCILYCYVYAVALQQIEKEPQNCDFKEHTIQKQINDQLPALPPICIQTHLSSPSMDHLESMDSNAPTMPLSDTPPPTKTTPKH